MIDVIELLQHWYAGRSKTDVSAHRRCECTSAIVARRARRRFAAVPTGGYGHRLGASQAARR